MSRYRIGIACCLLATAVWGGMFPVMTGALRHIDTFSFTCIRVAIAACAFLTLLVMREGVGALDLRGQRPLLAWFLGSIAFVGFGFLVFLGQQLAGPKGALTASVFMGTQPLLGLLVHWVVRKVRPSAWSFAFVALSFVGVSLVVTDGKLAALVRAPQDYAANGLILLGALCWVIYTIGVLYFPAWSPVKYTAVTTALSLPTMLASTAAIYALGIARPPQVEAIAAVLPHLAYMALLAGFVGVLSWNIGSQLLTPLNSVLFMDVVPLTAFVVSALSGVAPSLVQVSGAAVSAAALVLNNLYLRWHSTRSTTPSRLPSVAH